MSELHANIEVEVGPKNGRLVGKNTITPIDASDLRCKPHAGIGRPWIFFNVKKGVTYHQINVTQL